MHFSSPKLKKLIFFLKKISYISGGNLQSPRNKNFLCFPEKENSSYISG